MGLTNFPNGITSFGVPVMGSGSQVPFTLGSYFFVNSATGVDSTANGSKDKPFATIDYAIGRCTAGAFDVILVAPSHAESITTAGAITLDVAGVTIIGLGKGLARPTISLGAAAASVVISAANCSVKNIIFTANFADVATCFTVSGKDARIEECLFNEAGTDLNWLSCVLTSTTDNAADGLSVVNCERVSIDAAALAFISILGNCNRLYVAGNFDSQSSAANVGHFIIMAAKVCLSARIIGNILNLNGDNNAQTVGVFMTGSSTTSTGTVAYNLVNQLDATSELFDTATLDFGHFENRMTGTIAASGYVLPAIDS